MTIEERARKAAQNIINFIPIRRYVGCDDFHPDQMTAIIAAAIRAAVAEERERCAKVADSQASAYGLIAHGKIACETIARQIRELD